MKNRTRRSRRWLLRGLSLWLVVACLCVSVSAAGAEAEQVNAAVSEMGRGIDCLTVDAVPQELMEALTENGEIELAKVEPAQADALDCVTVRNSDDSLSRIAFQQPVKYIDEKTNEIKFIDNTIKQPDSLLARVFSEVAYENTSNSIRVSMPKKLGQGVRVEHGSDSLKMTPATGQEKAAVKKDVQRMDSAETVVEYADAFGEHTSMRYQPVSQGVKEYIVLEQYTGVHEFQFWLDAPGLTPDVTEGDTIRFLDASGELVFTITKAWAMDSYTEQEEEGEENAPESRHFDDNIQYRLQQAEDGRYLLTMAVSEEFLSNPDTVYPASIQSSAFYGYSEGGMSYTTVFSSTSTTWPSHTYEYIQTGYRSGYGESIGYVQFDNMDNFIDIHPSLISRVTVLAKQTYGNSSSYIIGAYDSNTSVASASATYSALNSSIGTQQDTTLCEGNAVYGWWITNIFKAWLGYELSGRGWNTYQLMLKATSTGQNYKQFYCSNSNLYFRVDFTQDNYGCAWSYNEKYNGVANMSNCFGYALGVNNVPALYMNYGDSVAVVALRVITYAKEKLGRSIRQIDGPTGSISSNEYRFCMRVGNYSQDDFDYHFWLQTDTGEWCHKAGGNAPQLLGYVDPATSDWPMRGVRNNYYNSGTIFFCGNLMMRGRDMKKIIASICSIVGVALFVGCAGTKDSSLLPTGEDSSETPDRVSNSVVSSSSADEASFFNSSSLPSSKVPDYLPTISQAQEDRERILSMENNSQSYQSLIHNTVDFVGLVEHNFYRMYLPSYSYNPSIESMDYYFPIECIRDMGDDRKYVIYRSEEGCLFYLFFRDEMAFYSHGVCISHARIKADFDTIQMGSTFSEVKAIDSDAKYWESESGLKASWSSYHLLKDGILVITYDDNQTVTEIDYSPDFVYRKAFGTNEEKMTVEYDYSILPQDYPA